MRRFANIAGFSVIATTLALATSSLAKPAESAQSKSCSAQATQKGLVGNESASFRATCLKGSLAPKAPTMPAAKSGAAVKAITAPSGADRTSRSAQCNAEAAKRGLHDSSFQSFRKGCLASAAPVASIESAKTPEKPTNAKPKIESLTNTQPK